VTAAGKQKCLEAARGNEKHNDLETFFADSFFYYSFLLHMFVARIVANMF